MRLVDDKTTLTADEVKHAQANIGVLTTFLKTLTNGKTPVRFGANGALVVQVHSPSLQPTHTRPFLIYTRPFLEPSIHTIRRMVPL